MKKTLFVKIDNTPAPVEAENDYITLDCKQINDFCSFVGNALIGDLKDSNGTPLYRLLNPAGRLLSDFEKIDKANYDLIIAQWLNILGEILHKGITQCDEQFTIRFPQQYTEWLLCNENDYFVEIGKSLQANDAKISLDADGISEDIISALHMKISRFLNNNKDDIEYIVFNNERIGNTSYAVKQLKTIFDSYLFMRLELWVQILQEEQQRRMVNLEDYRAFWIDKLKLGVTTRNDIETRHSVSDFYCYEGHPDISLKFNKKERLSDIYINDNTKPAYYLNKILSILYNKEVNRMNLNYSSMSSYLISKHNFVVSHAPSNVWKSELNGGTYMFQALLRKDEETYSCILGFYFFSKHYNTVSDCMNRLGTCTNITISLK